MTSVPELYSCPIGFMDETMTLPKPKASLAPAHVIILEELLRNGVHTNACLHTARFSHWTFNAVTKLTAALVERRFLNKHPLCPPQYYFTLGPQAVRYFGVSRRRTNPLGPQALPTQFGALYFCIHSGQRQARLLPQELQATYPWFPRSQLSLPFYFDLEPETQRSRLALIRTDLGAPADYLVRRCQHDLTARRSSAPEFARLIDAGDFMVTYVVATSDKAQSLSIALAKHSWPIRFRIAICSPLLGLLSRFPNGA